MIMRTCGICGCSVESGYWDPAPLGGVMVVCPACHRENFPTVSEVIGKTNKKSASKVKP